MTIDLLTDTALLGFMFALMVAPGLVAVFAAGLRGWWLTTAPLVTYGIVATSSALGAVLPMTWNAVTLALVTAVLAVLLWFLRTVRFDSIDWFERHQRPIATFDNQWGRAARWQALAAVALGTITATVTQWRTSSGLHNVHQEWDSTFHAVAIKVVADERSLQPAVAAATISPDIIDTFYYPLAWHGLTALGVTLGVLDVVAAFNAGLMLVVAVAVVSLAAIVRIWSSSLRLTIATAVMAPWPAAFPTDLLWRGSLAPFAMAVGCTPLLLLLVMRAVTRRDLSSIVLLAVGAAGLVSLHPGAVVLAVVLAAGILVHRTLLAKGATIFADAAVLAAAGIVAVVLSIPAILGALRSLGTAQQVDWLAFATPQQATWMLFSGTNWRPEPQWVLVVLLCFGLTALPWWGIRWWWWLVTAAIAGWLFVVAAAVDSPFSTAVTSFWWNDAFRFAAAAWQFYLVVAAAGVVACATFVYAVAKAIRRGVWQLPPNESRYAAGLTWVAVLALWVAVDGGYSTYNVQAGAWRWEEPIYLSDAEDDAYAELAAQIGPDAVVLNDPNDGSVWGFTLHGIDMIFKQHSGQDQLPLMSHAERTLFLEANTVQESEEVRAALETKDVDYIVLGTPDGINPYRPAGLQLLEDPHWSGAQGYFVRLPDVGPLRIWQVNPRGLAGSAGN